MNRGTERILRTSVLPLQVLRQSKVSGVRRRCWFVGERGPPKHSFDDGSNISIDVSTGDLSSGSFRPRSQVTAARFSWRGDLLEGF